MQNSNDEDSVVLDQVEHDVPGMLMAEQIRANHLRHSAQMRVDCQLLQSLTHKEVE